jgi:hypothetical protein
MRQTPSGTKAWPVLFSAAIGAAGAIIAAIIGIDAKRDRDVASAIIDKQGGRIAYLEQQLRASATTEAFTNSAQGHGNASLPESGKSGAAVPLSTPPTMSSGMKAALSREADFDIVLTKCVKSGGLVTCSLSLTNHGVEREFNFVASGIYNGTSRAFDEGHREIPADGAQLGTREGRLVRMSIPSGQTVNGGLFFSVPLATQTFTLLQVAFGLYDFNHTSQHRVEFRDVHLGES